MNSIKRMKKTMISLLLIFTMVVSTVFSFGTIAVAKTTETLTPTADADVDSMYWWNYWYDGWFAEGETPDGEAVYGLMSWLESGNLASYEVEPTEENEWICNKIPEADFEALVAKHFVCSDALIESLRSCNGYKTFDDGGYYVYYIGGWGGEMPEHLYQGYVSHGDGLFTLYGWQAKSYNDSYEAYVPDDDDVEGVDYVVDQSTTIAGDGGTTTNYTAMQLLGTVVTKIQIVDEDVVFLSQEIKGIDAMPDADDMVTEESIRSYVDIDFDYDAFNTSIQGVTAVQLTSGDTYTAVKSQVKSLGEAFVVYDTYAKDWEDNSISPQKAVTFTFDVPETFDSFSEVYRVADDGNLSKVSATVNKTAKQVTVKTDTLGTFVIVDNIALSTCTATLSYTKTTYNGNAKKPTPTVKTSAGKTLVKGTDYTVTYSNNKSAGTAKVTIKGIGKCTGTINKTFTISKASIKGKTIALSKSSYTYSGTAKKPTVKISGLTKGTDFTVSYSNNVNAGTAKVTIKGKGNYTGTVTKTYKIIPKNITSIGMQISTYNCTYDGTAKKPTVTVTGLTKGVDYKVTYSNNIKPGDAKVKITGIGNYQSYRTFPFSINVKYTSLKKVTAGSKKFTATWTKLDSKYITGYQIMYDTNKNMNNAKKTKLIGRKTTSKTISGLKASKTYYVKIRTYKVIDGKKYYSVWSDAEKVKTKK